MDDSSDGCIKEEAEGKKDKHKDKHKLMGYNKKRILKHLQTNGCSSDKLQTALLAFKVPSEPALEFMQKHIDKAEAHVQEECESICFENINNWLQLFKTWNLPQHCYYEPAIVINAIANNEAHPSPNEVNGVNLKEVYAFLGRALLGLPQPELSKESAAFLTSEFEVLVGEANTNAADAETIALKNRLQTETSAAITDQGHMSVDPLLLNPELSNNTSPKK